MFFLEGVQGDAQGVGSAVHHNRVLGLMNLRELSLKLLEIRAVGKAVIVQDIIDVFLGLVRQCERAYSYDGPIDHVPDPCAVNFFPRRISWRSNLRKRMPVGKLLALLSPPS